MMPGISEEDKNKYTEGIKAYRAAAQAILKTEQESLVVIKQKGVASALKQFEMSDVMLDLFSKYMAMNGMSLAIFDRKNEEALNEARKVLYKSIIYLEGIIGSPVDAVFSDYEKQLVLIESVSPAHRYRLIQRMGQAIQVLKNAFGDNSKWRWTFVEVEGRYAVGARNIISLRSILTNVDPSSPHYEPTVLHLRLVRKLLMQAADRYREKYELSTKRFDDFKVGISFLSALKRLNILTGEQLEAATVKKKLDAWTQKLNSDMAKPENLHGKKKG
jgi:hypothetical protein